VRPGCGTGGSEWLPPVQRGLVLLGVSLAGTLWMGILPVVAVLVAAAAALHATDRADTTSAS